MTEPKQAVRYPSPAAAARHDVAERRAPPAWRPTAESQKTGPPVIILNMFHSGLGIARAMAGRGVRVVGLSAQRNAFGNFTRLCEVRPAPDSCEEPEALARYLLSLLPEFAGAVIFPTRDFDVLFLNHFRSELEHHYRIAIPPEDCLAQILDKAALARVAECAGLSVPRTMKLGSLEECEEVSSRIGFPCVVKPVRSVHWHGGDNWRRVGSRKGFIARSPEELRRGYNQVSAVNPEVLVQEWIPGGVENIVVMGAYVDQDLGPLSWFTARKIVQSPEDFGTGCVVRSEAVPELLSPCRRLWRTLQFSGMAEVEFKRDAQTGEHRLIEMNARHWDQHELGCASGTNLTWIAYCHLTGRPLQGANRPVRPAVWIAEDALLGYLLRTGVRRMGFRSLFARLSGRRIYGILSPRDPWPIIRYSFGEALPGILRGCLRKLRPREEESSDRM